MLGHHVKILIRPPRVVCDDDARGAVAVGIVFGLSFTCRTCMCNAHNALCKRHGSRRPDCVAEDVEFLGFVSDFLPYVSALLGPLMDYWHDNWLAKWPVVKQLMITKSMLEDPYLPEKCNVMVKYESGHDEPKKARLIQFYRNLRTQAEEAWAFYALQKAYAEVFSGRDIDGISVTFASGMNALAIAHWMQRAVDDYGSPYFYERDGKNWDSCMGALCQWLKEQMYAPAGERVVAFSRACYTTTNRFSKAHARFVWTVEGTTRSGHNDTTLGNSLMNAAIIYAVMRAHGLRGHILVAGDDLLVAFDHKPDCGFLVAQERRFGIVPEARVFSSPYDVTFVSGAWFPAVDGFGFGPQPGRLLARLFYTLKPCSYRKVRSFAAAVAAGMWPTCHSLPVVGAFLKAHMLPGADITPLWKHHYDGSRQTAPESIYDFFAIKYGVGVDELRKLESEILGLGYVRAKLSSPIVDRIMERDFTNILLRQPIDF